MLWIMGLTSGRPINSAQVWVYFSWTYQISHEIRISLTDSRLNNKSLLTLSKMLSRIAVQINPGISSGTQAIVPSDTSPSLTTTTGATPIQCNVSPPLSPGAGAENIWTGHERCSFIVNIKKKLSKTRLNVLLTRCWVISNGHYEGRSLHYKTDYFMCLWVKWAKHFKNASLQYITAAYTHL